MTEIGEKHPSAQYYLSFPLCQCLVWDIPRKQHDSSHETVTACRHSRIQPCQKHSKQRYRTLDIEATSYVHLFSSPDFGLLAIMFQLLKNSFHLCSTWKAMRSGAAVYSQHHTRSVWTMVTSNHTIATKRADISQESVLDDLHQALLPKLSAIDGLWTTFKASSFQASPQGDQCKLRCLTT